MTGKSKTKGQIFEELNQSPKRITEFESHAMGKGGSQNTLGNTCESWLKFFSGSVDGAMLLDKRGTILTATRPGADLFGLRMDELVGLEASELFPPELAIRIKEKAMQVVASGTSLRFEDKLDGRYLEITHLPIFDKQRKVNALTLSIRDVTQRIKVDEALNKSEEKFRAIYKCFPTPTYLWQRVGNDLVLVDYSHSAEIQSRGEIGNYIGTSYKEFFSHEPGHIEFFDWCYHERTTSTREMRYRLRTTGEELYAIIVASYVPPDLVVGHILDITKRKKAEEALKERKKQLQQERRSLEEANTALNFLLEHRNEEKLRIQDNIVSAVSNLVTPFMEKLNKTDLDEQQKTYLGVIASNLDEILSPLAARLFHRHANLTPRELEVVNLVRAGKSIKETAELLFLSEDAIGFHRKNIRAKLGLKNKKINLYAYLQQLAVE